MFKAYREVLGLKGAWKFSLAGFITRFPMSMVGISIILLISTVYDSYAIAGQVAAASNVAYALAVPLLARMVDKYGQRKIMYPAILISSLNLVLLSVSAMLGASPWLLYLFSILAGAFSGSVGGLVRARWSRLVSNPHQLHTAFALESAIDEIVYVVGPIIATVLTTSVYPPAGLVCAVIFNVVGASWFFSQRSTEPAVVCVQKNVKYKSLIRIPAIVALCVIYLGAGTMFGLIDIVVVAFAEEQGYKSASGIMLAMIALGSMIAAFVYGSRRWDQPVWKLLVGGVILLGLGVSSFLVASSIVGLSVAMFVTGLTIAPTMTNVNNMVQSVVPDFRLTEGLSWMSTSINVGVSSGAFLGGYLVDYGGSRVGLNVAVLFAWVMVSVALLATPVLRRASK